jgi:ketosteroid isomerase-like protein
MNDITAVRQAVDQLLEGRLAPLLELLAEQVVLEVIGSEDVRRRCNGSGRHAVIDYFTALGVLPAFWQIDYTGASGEVIAWGKESFTVEGSGLEGGCDFALVFNLSNGLIVRILVVEDLALWLRGRGRGRRRTAASLALVDG